MSASESHYAKAALAVSIISLLVMAIGTYASWYTATQAANAANQAVDIANSAYSIANNYPPHIEIVSSALTLRPQLCARNVATNNSTCVFVGAFNVTFTIISPHVGTYSLNVSSFSGIGPFSPGPVGYSPGRGGWLVRIGNATISMYPPLRTSQPLRGGVPSSEPFSKTIEVDVVGLTLTTTSSAVLNISGQGALSASLAYEDVQTQKLFVSPFTVQVFFWLG